MHSISIERRIEMKYRVAGIEYSIEPEDVMDEFDEDSFALRSDLIEACENRIDEILENLPSEMVVEIEDYEEDEDIDDAICDAVSERTGWLVKGLSYQKLGSENE